MENKLIFTKALGLTTDHEVCSIEFKEGLFKRELHIQICFVKGVKFDFEGQIYSGYDKQARSWRHMDFFEHPCYIHCNVPRIKSKAGQVMTVEVPWATSYSRNTHQFEDFLAKLAKEGLSFSAISRLTGVGSKCVQEVIKSKVMMALANEPLANIKHLSVDETSSKKGHNYLTILSDNTEKKVVGIGFGKDKNAVDEAIKEVNIRNSDIAKVKTVTMDMSRSFIAAANELIPQADIIFDRFHIVMHLNKRVDNIRKTEAKNHNELKNTKYYWLKNHINLSKNQQAEVLTLSESFPTLGMAYVLKEKFKLAWDNSAESGHLKWLNAWIKEVKKANIPELTQFISFLYDHWYGIKTYFKYLKNNGFAERVNLKIQEIKRTAKGFRNLENFKNLIYFHLGNFKFDYPL